MRHSGVSRNLQYSVKCIKMSQIYVFIFPAESALEIR